MLYSKLNCQTVFKLKHTSHKVLQRGFSVCTASSNDLVQWLGLRVQGLEFQGWGLEFGFYGLWFMVYGLWFMVYGSWFGFRV